MTCVEIEINNREETSVASPWLWLEPKRRRRRRRRFMGGRDCCGSILWSEVVLWICKIKTRISASHFLVSLPRGQCQSGQKFHSSVTSVVWLWHLAVTKGIPALLRPTKSKQSHSENMIGFDEVSKHLWNTGRNVEKCALGLGLIKKKKKSAELEMMYHHKNYIFRSKPWLEKHSQDFTHHVFIETGKKKSRQIMGICY